MLTFVDGLEDGRTLKISCDEALEHFHERRRLGKRGQVPKAGTALRVRCTFGT